MSKINQKHVPHKIKKNPRFVAMNLLTQVSQNQAYSNLLVDKGIREGNLDARDARLMTEIVYGTLSRQLTLEYYLAPFIQKAKKIEPWVKQLLLLSLYQLTYLDRVPAHGVVNDAVEIAKAYGNPGIGKFVNGVLRNVLRQERPDLSKIKDATERLSIQLSLPEWLVEKLIATIGEEETIALGESLVETSRSSARVNTKYMTQTEAIAFLQEDGYEVEASKVSPVGIVGPTGFLAGSSLFERGEITIQDESSMLVAPSLQLQPSDYVLDACAAPGGKTTHIAQYLEAEQGGRVLGLDIHQHKTKLIEKNAERLHLGDVVTAQQLDARQVSEMFEDETFDKILVDAPCSGLGLLRRKPDIKYSKKPSDFANLPKIQLEILESVATKVKQYGIITYSTCTILPEENQEVVQQFLINHPEFEIIEVAGAEPFASKEKWITLYPHQYGTDGFFICSLQRKAK
ncbi:16S rRNA (cytosine(967)-C(5))-methyltransferase RsmB [Vagococcus zengguangii]|uniref:16S rRNA (cytosine(967)-C(5))-methyltransferase n=1 Tax=Vagococcus zengguangii TaxID=2571750 RepID=A0A4D7CRJ7_9ENTE|nr:16S rRNA (cytosine(967)-C(5))-methyltransferase RsmB [Vagococcus zengguangii]QCI86689.1 16S rRNA (cytosine(967)-C(5))-methyltransferase RsmB [Vagococcus zengguangii]TLG78445.1 16S rRNA (cytosine(967)-C(5))-methyltransferase RsmB [Vagococcus zengguangii]